MAGALRIVEVSENIFVFTLGGEGVADSFGANCTAVVGRDAVLLVDPLIAPAHARLVEEAVRRKSAKPIRLVALTHHHTDHALGSSWFSRQGATVVATSICRERMAAEHPAVTAKRREIPELAALFSGVEFGVPGSTLDPPATLELGDLKVDIRVLGPGHTPGDLILISSQTATTSTTSTPRSIFFRAASKSCSRSRRRHTCRAMARREIAGSSIGSSKISPSFATSSLPAREKPQRRWPLRSRAGFPVISSKSFSLTPSKRFGGPPGSRDAPTNPSAGEAR